VLTRGWGTNLAAPSSGWAADADAARTSELVGAGGMGRDCGMAGVGRAGVAGRTAAGTCGWPSTLARVRLRSLMWMGSSTQEIKQPLTA
jgi:hypothetical protein